MDPGSLREMLEAAFSLIRNGRHQDAVGMCARILVQYPDQADALHLMGVANMERGRPEDAADVLARAVAVRPGDPEILGNLGVVYLALERAEDAADTLERAVEHSPQNLDLLTNLGAAQRAAGRLAAAEASLQRALALRRDHVPALFNLANTHVGLGHLDRAESLYQRVVELSPGHADALSGLGFVFKEQGRFEDAVNALERCLAIAPGKHDTRCQLGQAQLTLGRFAGGWENYLARLTSPTASVDYRRAPLPDDLSGTRILVCRDQGLGDEIFFARFLPQLAARGAAFAYWADPRLVAMFERGAIAPVVYDSDPEDNFDFRLLIGDLPFVLGMDGTERIPPSIRLEALPDRSAALAGRLRAFGPPPYIGVTWRAGTENLRRVLYKVSPLERMAAALARIDARVIVVQRGPSEDEMARLRAALGRTVCDLSALNDDLEDMLALVGLLDDYVCVSNTNVHLRATQDRACRLLIPNPPDFRWMAAGSESPWFPGCPVYRQAADGDWTAAFDALGRDLETAFETP